MVLFFFSHSPSLTLSSLFMSNEKHPRENEKKKKKRREPEPKALVSYCDCSVNKKKRNGRLCRIHTYRRCDGSVKRTGHHQPTRKIETRGEARERERLFCVWNLMMMTAPLNTVCGMEKTNFAVQKIPIVWRWGFSFVVWVRMCVCAHVKDNAIFAKEYRPPATVFEPNRDRAPPPYLVTPPHTHTIFLQTILTFHILGSSYATNDTFHMVWNRKKMCQENWRKRDNKKKK